jgi:uncharacterized protein (DUF2267 family)
MAPRKLAVKQRNRAWKRRIYVDFSESQQRQTPVVEDKSQQRRAELAAMTGTGLDVFDKSVQTTNIWLQEICEEIGPDKQIAWHVLGASLRALRDRLQPELAAHLAAELPLVVRGAYYDRYRPSEQPRLTRSRDEFVKSIETDLANIRPVNADQATQCVFQVLNRHIPKGQIDKVRATLPEEIRDMWPEPDGQARGEAPKRKAARGM